MVQLFFHHISQSFNTLSIGKRKMSFVELLWNHHGNFFLVPLHPDCQVEVLRNKSESLKKKKHLPIITRHIRCLIRKTDFWCMSLLSSWCISHMPMNEIFHHSVIKGATNHLAQNPRMRIATLSINILENMQNK